MKFLISASTDVGIKREKNEDSILAMQCETSLGEATFVCVCDGMGGLDAGELASATILSAFRKWAWESLPMLTQTQPSREAIVGEWRSVVDSCNGKLLRYGRENGSTVGTTLCAGLFIGGEYFIANIGDSRAYEIAGEVVQLTRDHSFVAREVECGRMTEEEAEISPKRNVLTRCIGAKPDVVPEFFFGKIRKNAVYLFCSDGFRHLVTKSELAERFSQQNIVTADDLKRAELELIELNKSRVETDNISVVTLGVRAKNTLGGLFRLRTKPSSEYDERFSVVKELAFPASESIIEDVADEAVDEDDCDTLID